jgi:hypothetical protein
MKKAKPSKGSARTKRFLDGGAVGALAGLGTLAYLMSRKKKGESEASVPTDKSGYSSGPVNVGKMIEGRGDEEPSAEVKRAMAASKGRSELIPEGATDADRATMYGDTVAKRVMPTPKSKARTASQTFPISKPAKTTKAGGEGFGKTASLAEDSSQAKAMREQRKQRLGTEYAKQYSAYQAASEGPQKEALKQSMEKAKRDYEASPMKKGGKVKKYASGGSVSSASKRADGIAQRGKTKGRIC